MTGENAEEREKGGREKGKWGRGAPGVVAANDQRDVTSGQGFGHFTWLAPCRLTNT